MNRIEQEVIKQKYWEECSYYMENAYESLKKAEKKDLFFQNKKYVRTACGTAYNALLIGIEGICKYKGMEVRRKVSGRKNKMDYVDALIQVNKKLHVYFQNAYNVLHLDGYYDGITKVKTIMSGFEDAEHIINILKPSENLGKPKKK